MNFNRGLRWTVMAVALGIFGVPARADTVHLTNGKIVKGRVASYANSAFNVEDDNRAITSLPAAGVTSIEFEKKETLATLERRAGPKLQGRAWLYDKGNFLIENAQGETERISALTVTKATFVLGPSTEAAPKKVATVKPVVPPAESKAGASTKKVARINNAGSRVDVSQHLVAGKVTIVDFYADWCGPCRHIAPTLENLAETDADVYLRKVDILRWGSPVAEQYRIDSIPRIEVYNREGKLVDTIRGANAAAVAEVVKRAKGKA
jgi:thiol-disulfide isomerase/thioredoxin